MRLESRLRNLVALPSKRNAIGVAQARLAVSVVRAFIEGHMNEGGDPRTVRQAVKRVEKLALDAQLSRVAFTHDIDVLAAIPLDRENEKNRRGAKRPTSSKPKTKS